MQKFGTLVSSSEHLQKVLNVPQPIMEMTTKHVLVSEFVQGVPIGKVASMDQSTRDMVGTAMLRLCLSELFEWRVMQTDPNWTNFLFDANSNTIHLIDFGATIEYSKEFLDIYLDLLKAAASKNQDESKELSKQLGFLTGVESEVGLIAKI